MKQIRFSIFILIGILTRSCFLNEENNKIYRTRPPDTTTTEGPTFCPELKPECRCVGSWDFFNLDCYFVDDIRQLMDKIRTLYGNLTINHIYFQSSNFTVLPNQIFENFTINQLFFDRLEEVEIIENKAFDNIIDVSILRLVNTRLSIIPQAVAILNLSMFDLSKSKIEEVNGILQNMTELQYLRLNNNLIRRIDIDAFVGTRNLQKLVLSHNLLTTLPKGLFRNAHQLIELFLGNNLLANLDGVFEPFCWTITIIHLENNSLSNIDNIFETKAHRLRYLNLSQNKLHILTKNSFASHYPVLDRLYLNDNNLTIINYDTFLTLPILSSIAMTLNNVSFLPSGLFDNLHQIKHINLSQNKLISAEGLFTENSENLIMIALSWNNISEIYGVFQKTTKLIYLILTSNNISTIRNYTFANNSALVELELSHNIITVLESMAFIGLRALEKLNLGNNQILSVGGAFKITTLKGLRLLWLTKNNISKLEGEDFSGLQFLLDMELTYNKLLSIEGAFVHLKDISGLTLGHNRLRTITLESVPLNNSLRHLTLTGNPLDCDCRLLWILDAVKVKKITLDESTNCNTPMWLKNKRLSNLTAFNLTNWPQDCPDPCNCQCQTNQSEITVLVNCTRLQLTNLPEIFPIKTSTLDLTGNRISEISSNLSSSLPNLQNLLLEENLLTSLNGLADLIPNLKTLLVARNKLTVFPVALFSKKVFKSISLSDNPWICDCQTEGFQTWLLSNAKMIIDVNDTKCATSFENGNLGGLSIILLSGTQLCPLPLPLYIIIIIAALAFLFTSASLGVAYIRYKMPIKVWLYTRGICSCLSCVKEEDLDEGKTYDAFIAYSHLDYTVAIELMNRLEKNAPFYKICIHDRDFPPGVHIMDNIKNSVDSSKKTVILLSRNFLKGEWPLQEFQVAYDQMVEMKMNRILLVLLEENPLENEEEEILENKSLSSLIEYMKVSTYVKWYDKYFWEKFIYAMPRNSVNDGIDPRSEITTESTVVITEIDQQPLLWDN